MTPDAPTWGEIEKFLQVDGWINSTLRAVALRGEPGGDRELAELRRLVGEALASLPEEEQRLQRLATAPATELPGLAQALRAG